MKLRKPLIALALALAVVVSVVSGFLSPAQAQAGSRTGQTTISWIVAKHNHTEIKMDGGLPMPAVAMVAVGSCLAAIPTMRHCTTV